MLLITFTLAGTVWCCFLISCPQELFGAVQITPLSSGYSLGSSNWIIQSHYEKVSYVSGSSLLTTHPQVIQHSPAHKPSKGWTLYSLVCIIIIFLLNKIHLLRFFQMFSCILYWFTGVKINVDLNETSMSNKKTFVRPVMLTCIGIVMAIYLICKTAPLNTLDTMLEDPQLAEGSIPRYQHPLL